MVTMAEATYVQFGLCPSRSGPKLRKNWQSLTVCPETQLDSGNAKCGSVILSDELWACPTTTSWIDRYSPYDQCITRISNLPCFRKVLC